MQGLAALLSVVFCQGEEMAAAVVSFNTEIMDISKLKVPDLKRELKARGLSTTGNKNDLIVRLQAALKCKLDDTIGIDDLDEDLLNDDDDEHLDTSESVIQDLDSALEVPSTEKSFKRKLLKTPESANQDDSSDPPKKIVLNRNPSVCSDTCQKENGVENTNATQVAKNTEKKVIKLSELSVKERLEMRAKKFGVQLSADAKKVARSERFGSRSIKTDGTSASLEVLQKRAERFGGSVSTVMSNLEKEKLLEKRKERFGVTNGATSQSEKAKQRLERFKEPL